MLSDLHTAQRLTLRAQFLNQIIESKNKTSKSPGYYLYQKINTYKDEDRSCVD